MGPKAVSSFILLVAAIASLKGASGGSPCPSRSLIYPCLCVNVPPRGRSMQTMVLCQGLHNSDSLLRVYSVLKTLQMDQFYLYDCFWGAENDQNKQILPPDWITHLRVNEYHFIDTILSPSFACGWSFKCKNEVTTKFMAMNSSSANEIDTLCDTGTLDKFSWANCFTKLEHFEFTFGKLISLKLSFFSQTMQELRVLNFTHNHIQSIERRFFSKFPKLVSLDLSHNMLESLIHVFETPLANLEFLDLSWNKLKIIGFPVFSQLPRLASFKLDSNDLVRLKDIEWKDVHKYFKAIDISHNPFHCDCSAKWMNTTFPAKVKLEGYCGSPADSQGVSIRRKTNYCMKKCP